MHPASQITKEIKMECPECKEVFSDPSMTILGQSMCPACGNILEYTDIISDEYYEENNENNQ